ncbi:MAG TPA: transporter substrate-binding domain-containing protein, partial [Candidatus Binatia bacterium]|nr:transporter substrate-binding domain-containing protein [Candidatus Binatia bacterium]
MIETLLRSDLAPTGKLRVGINYGNPVLATRDSVSGELRGVAVDLARELGTQADLPIELVPFESAGKMFDAVKAGAWDVAFLAIDPGRAG